MASGFSFEVDQTDEDFFDKLVVDDDDDIVVSSVSVKSKLDDSVKLVKANDSVFEDDSDEVKAFANLSVIEAGHEKVECVSKEVSTSVVNNGSLPVDGAEVGSLLPLSGSFSFDNGELVEDGDGVGGLEEKTGLVRESSGSPGVKEVQWSDFTDSGDQFGGGFGSYDDFLKDFGQEGVGNVQSEVNANAVLGNETISNVAVESVVANTEQIACGLDTSTIEYYENMYPGWKFDANTGQWYQLSNTGGNVEASGGSMQGNFAAVSDVNSSEAFYSQQNVQASVGAVSQLSTSTTEKLSDWNHTSQQNQGYQYPANMIFDPQYPGWYYDSLAQEWCSLDTYHQSLSTELTNNQQSQGSFSGGTYSHGGNDQVINGNEYQVSGNEDVYRDPTYATSLGQSLPSYDSNVYGNSQVGPQKFSNFRGTAPLYEETNKSLDSSAWAGSAGNAFQPINHVPQVSQNQAAQYSSNFYSNQNTAKVSQPLFPNGHHVSYAPTETRTLTGRPPHALVTFGFGGKLVVMKDSSATGFSLHGSKDADGYSLSVLNLIEVVGGPSGTSASPSSYFLSLCHQSFPGPLVGGNAGSKEMNRWIDERIANCESRSANDDKGEAPKLLLSLLKVACQHYGKLRSFGVDVGVKDNDLPESAVASLFANAKSNGSQFSQYNAGARCLTTLPSEAHIQATASEVQTLLISGRKREALQRAQEGQFWDFALILARELGDQFYADTVKQMAVSKLVPGSPLRTLCLLIAKKPEEVFTNSVIPAGNLPGAVAMPPQPVQSAGYSMLTNWEENLAVITANRTENDNLVIINLGDCLWKDKNDVTAAHICYLIAEADFELYSDTSRLCLIGADHWNFPRTYASPQAIQRTEVFEYAKVMGNSQFVLLPLQSYKLIYAHMLAEVGRVSDSLKYCQAVHKALKTARSPEVDMLKQLAASLEERIGAHQQSGYAANLAPAKVLGKIFSMFDSTAHRVVGGLPPPAPSNVVNNAHHYQSPGSNVVRSSQSTMGMSSLMPSASMEPINQWAGDESKMTLQNRSISEPNIGRSPTPDPVDASNEVPSSTADSKSSGLSKKSSIGRFGASIFQKAVGLVLKTTPGRQAKLGDQNKFYYDEKLKRWVEEGAEPPAEEPALAPPPTSMNFQTEKSDNYSKTAFSNGPTPSSGSPEATNATPPGSSFGIPAIPQSSNQFSARGRMGVRSRYVDTFNKGGGTSTNSFQAPSIPFAQPASQSNAKFFIPTASATSSNQPTFGTDSQTRNDVPESEDQKSSTPGNDPFQNLAPSPDVTMQRFPSVDNIPRNGTMRSGYSPSPGGPPQSRRTSSWSTFHSNTPSSESEVKPPSPLSFMPSNGSSGSLHGSGGSVRNDLHKVEL